MPVTIAEAGVDLVEPLSQGSEKIRPSVARMLTDIGSQTAHIRVANPTASNMTIVKGTAIAQVTPLQDVEVSVRPPSSTKGGVGEVAYGENLDSSLAQRFKALLQEYDHLFPSASQTLGRTEIVEHDIDTNDSKPMRQNPYRNSAAERRIIEEQVSKMLEKGVIRESTSPWSSPVVLV